MLFALFLSAYSDLIQALEFQIAFFATFLHEDDDDLEKPMEGIFISIFLLFMY